MTISKFIILIFLIGLGVCLIELPMQGFMGDVLADSAGATLIGVSTLIILSQ